jgi:hypothetical protein
VLTEILDSVDTSVLTNLSPELSPGSYPAINSSTKFPLLKVLAYLIPGKGKKTKDHCNTVTGVNYCPNGHTVEPISYHCKNWNCPECFPWAASQAARRAADRLTGVQMAWSGIGKPQGPLNHIELSVPPELYEKFDLKKFKAKAIDYAKRIGISGGALIFHPFRIKDELKGPIREALKALLDDYPTHWKGVHKNVLGLTNWREYIEFGPHFHFLGYFKLKERSDSFYEKTGWTYKNISYAKRKRPEDSDSVYRIMRYLLTHHHVEQGKQSVTYFGTCSYNKIEKTTSREKEYLKCPVCLEQMYRIAVWSEKQYERIKSGEEKPIIDENTLRSKIVRVRNWYKVKTTQVTIETQYIDDPPGDD